MGSPALAAVAGSGASVNDKERELMRQIDAYLKALIYRVAAQVKREREAQRG